MTRVGLLLSLGLCLAACGPKGQDALPGPVDLPEVSILGEEPPRAGRVDITITALGEVYVGTVRTTLDDMRPLLLAASGGAPPDEETLDGAEETEVEIPERDIDVLGSRDPGPRGEGVLGHDGRRNADVLLRIDRGVMWLAAMRVMQQCAHPEVRLARLFVAVRERGAERTGALAVFLPMHRCSCADAEIEGVVARVAFGSRVRSAIEGDGVVIEEDGVSMVPESFGRLVSHLRRRRPLPDTPLGISVSAEGSTSWQDLVTVADAAVRAGAHSFTMEGRPTHEELDAFAKTFTDLSLRLKAQKPSRAWVLGDPVVDQPLGGSLPAGMRKGYLGFANDPSLDQLLEEELDLQPEETPDK